MKFNKLGIILTLIFSNVLIGQKYDGPLFEQCRESEPSVGGDCNKAEMLRFITQSLIPNMQEIKKNAEVKDVLLSFDIIQGNIYKLELREKEDNRYFTKNVEIPSLYDNKVDDFISKKDFRISCTIPKGLNIKEYNISITEKGFEIFKVVQEMPRFPGCEDLETEAEKKSCADTKMRDYIYNNIVYPPEAIENKVNGNVVVQFVIEKDGFISEINVVRSMGYGCDQAAIDVVESMNSMEEPWRPGYQREKPVRVIYTLPIKFDTEKRYNSKED
ncbi:MAG TPA: energy transducer TonB [Saprospiraceae bacterium]|nr:energy transducer TonB [Saprospiraceae bacterium]